MKALHGDELGEKLIHKDVKFIHTIRFTLSIYLASITVEAHILQVALTTAVHFIQ